MTEGSWRVWLSMALVASIAANVYLFRIAQQRGEGETRGNRYTLREGDRVPPVEGNSREGGSVRVEYGTDARPTVLYVVTATCAWCSRNAENFASIVRQKQQSHRFVVVALHREKLDQLASTMPEGVDLLAEVSEQTKQQYYLGGTPQTIVVSSRGVIVKSWLGAYNDRIGREVADYFDVRLPGLTDNAPATDGGCLDESGRSYSRGFVTTIKGVQRECGADGEWTAASR